MLAGLARALGAALLLAAGAAATNAQNVAAVSNDRYVQYFDLIVFGNEIPGQESNIIRKWTVPIRFKVGGLKAAVDKFRPTLAAHMAALTAVSGVTFQEVAPDEPGENYVIWFSTTPNMITDGRALARNAADLAGLKDANCYFMSYYHKDGTMAAGRVVANSDLPDSKLAHCLLEELTQSLGLPNDDSRVSPSLFNDTMSLSALSMIDRVLVRLVYDPRLPPGTPRPEALRIARAILEELNPGG